MKKYIILLSIAMLVSFFVQAQNYKDALRYSDFQVQGTARSGGMGNAFGALGADFTSVSINPAGLGMYRSGELSITPKFGQIETESNYLGSIGNDSQYKFSLNNLSYVSAIQTSNRSEAGIVNINFGIGFNRLKDFNGNAVVGADNVNSSSLDYLADNANYDVWSDNYEELAWETYLINFDEDANEYWHEIRDAGYGQSQRKSISRQGSIDEYTLGLGLNFNHKFYLGASLGIMDVYYVESSSLEEWDKKDNIPFFNEMAFDEYLRTSGMGYNVKLGVIFKPTNALRLGASIHTPTFYNLNDVFENSMTSSVNDSEGSPKNYAKESPYNEYDYDLESPLRATLSGSYVIAKKGLVSVDYEFVNYGSAKLRRGGDGYSFVDENNDIAELYKSTGNLRLGGEYKATNTISLRAGLELYPSAFNSNAFGKSQPNAGADLKVYSAGLGYRSGGFYADVAYRYTDMMNYNQLYPAPGPGYPVPEMASFNTVKNNVLFTLGFRF